ncbi:MAG TPA: PDZ domain-containing protein [Spirochaetota bacterium]|jgi:type II secretion system protein C|nr:PDZ domain-containing protein [Spirochaetota bacterium]HOK01110.1 PDZ domain-containing protein [Spirochaetota bacterium]HOK91435.1 PDZ domain-containing protein [Spirochaetota bacterium]HON16537.1 PDZ domain-containing protein [Spirochaetota bacterium]HPP94088.1 PDZ domain-containing protein [Spirochaetota bacterium]
MTLNNKNIFYHGLTFIAAVIFAFVTAITINQVFKGLFFVYPSEKKRLRPITVNPARYSEVKIDKILESGFFRATVGSATGESDNQITSEITDLKLLGTVTGPSSIARALILKKGEKQASVFRIGSDVYGYTLSGVESSKVYLKSGSSVSTLSLYEKKDLTGEKSSTSTGSVDTAAKKTISRAEFQQKMLNDIDNAMQGVKAGPYRVNGQIEGFQLIRIRPYNVLYEYGLRSGDIIKRINGKKVDSTEKLYNMWQGFKNESQLVFDIERDGKVLTLSINITD